MMEIAKIDAISLQKDSIKRIVENTEALVVEGFSSAPQLIARAKFLEEVADRIRKSPIIKEAAMKEVGREGNKGLVVDGCKMVEREAGVKYDYKNSPAWVAAKEQLNRIEEAAKKSTYKGEEFMLDSGEVLMVYPPIRTSTTTLIVELPK